MGKWTEVAKTLPRRAEEPGPFREKVHAIKDEARRGAKLESLAARYRHLRGRKAKLEALGTKLNAALAAFEELLADTFRDEAREIPFSFSDGARIEVSDQPSFAVSDNDALLAWVNANGYVRLLSLHTSRVGSLGKAALEAGKALPDGVVASAYSQVKFVDRRK